MNLNLNKITELNWTSQTWQIQDSRNENISSSSNYFQYNIRPGKWPADALMNVWQELQFYCQWTVKRGLPTPGLPMKA